MSEHLDAPPTDFATELVLEYLTAGEELAASASMLTALGGTPQQAGANLHAWVIDNNPYKDQPTLFSELAVWALGFVSWNDVAATFMPEVVAGVEEEGSVHP